MKRGQFIRVMGAGSTVLLVPSIFHACSPTRPISLEGWRGPGTDIGDIRIVVLSYAVLAANPHNKQPWIIDLTGPRSLDLYVDQSRLLPETDPPARQIHIGHGTFLENLDLAARQFGYRAEITYFPQGSYGNTVIESRPVASISFGMDSGIRRDALFDQVLKRQSNKRPYSDESLTQAELDGVVTAYDNDEFPMTITTDSAQRVKLAEIMVKAMQIENTMKKREAETIAMFRFSSEEMEKYRDGFGLAQSGISGFKKFFAETFFLSRESALAEDSSFGKAAVDLTESQANTAAAFGWITSPSNTRLDQVRIGRAYERVNLMATALGVAMHPMSQVLQEYLVRRWPHGAGVDRRVGR